MLFALKSRSKQATYNAAGFHLKVEVDAEKMRLLIHSAKQVVTITSKDVSFLSGRTMKSVEVLENNNGSMAVAVGE
jgi:hypothetical protein